jgi:hypothetical protein
MLRSFKSAPHWLGLRHDGGLTVSESHIEGPFGPSRLVRIAPSRARGGGPRLPVWIAQHGVTTLGADHPAFQAFVRGIAASGAVVLLPEFRPWIELDLSTEGFDALLRATIRAAQDDPLVDLSRVHLMGISFAGSQVLISAGQPGIREHVGHVVTFGAYHGLDSLLRFQLTGQIPDGEQVRQIRPDPYALWLTALNLLPLIEGVTAVEELQQVLKTLLMAGSRLAVTGAHPGFDPLKRELGRRLNHGDRVLFEAIAPLSTERWPVPRDCAAEWLERLLDAVRRADGRLDPMAQICELPPVTSLVHGRGDILIPPSESRALLESLRDYTDPILLLTGVVEHSQRSRARSMLDATREWVHLIVESNRVLTRI